VERKKKRNLTDRQSAHVSVDFPGSMGQTVALSGLYWLGRGSRVEVNFPTQALGSGIKLWEMPRKLAKLVIFLKLLQVCGRGKHGFELDPSTVYDPAGGRIRLDCPFVFRTEREVGAGRSRKTYLAWG